MGHAYHLYSDGACRGNPGPGGWGFVAQDSHGQTLFEGRGFSPQSTNNIMELSAGLFGMRKLLQWARGAPICVCVYSDSKYFVQGMNEWIHNWKRRGWKKGKSSSPPENLELWKQLDELRGHFQKVSFHWVKGHSGHPLNDRCDELANLAIDANLSSR